VAEVRLILAHESDASARALASRWGSEALLLTVADLHRARWCLELDQDGRARTGLASAAGTPLPVDGVVNRLGVITPADLPRVHPEDRQYAAAELTAFMLAWLDASPVPVLNRPGAGSLNGPAWYPEQWAAAAVAVGLQVPGIRRRVALAAAGGCPAPDPARGDVASARVVVGTCFGDVHPAVGERLCELARFAGTPLLAATVEGHGPAARVRNLSVWPDLADPVVSDAVAAALRPGAVAAAPRPAGEVRRAPVAVS
jgi:hypothetical protein